ANTVEVTDAGHVQIEVVGLSSCVHFKDLQEEDREKRKPSPGRKAKSGSNFFPTGFYKRQKL
ncbi:MAG: hypothetical protein KJ740_11830, partial [Gammaproteobacteria bacterium]|nr:hypothetical protein [Gammaproteobacteria bacterium]